MTTVFVDADACPVTRDAISIARAHRVPVVLVGNESQNLARYDGRTGVETVQVAAGRDTADFAIVARLAPEDVVVTGWTGLLALHHRRGDGSAPRRAAAPACRGTDARAFSVRGR
jgi:uncharacterized protein YaiI (UPF0178 family)